MLEFDIFSLIWVKYH